MCLNSCARLKRCLAFLVGGNMSLAASGQGGLMVRVDPQDTDALLTKPHTRSFEMRGRELRGWLRVDSEGLRTKRQLDPWVRRGVAYARSLPPKRSSAHKTLTGYRGGVKRKRMLGRPPP